MNVHAAHEDTKPARLQYQFQCGLAAPFAATISRMWHLCRALCNMPQEIGYCRIYSTFYFLIYRHRSDSSRVSIESGNFLPFLRFFCVWHVLEANHSCDMLVYGVAAKEGLHVRLHAPRFTQTHKRKKHQTMLFMPVNMHSTCSPRDGKDVLPISQSLHAPNE